MALPDYIKVSLGTAVIWGEDSGSGVTLTLAVDALAAGSARMGDVADLGENFDEEYMVFLIVESGTAPTAGGTVDLYLVCTDDTARYPGGVSGTDGAWPGDGDEDQWAKQLGAPVVQLIATNDANTVQAQAPVIWRPAGRYVVPVLDNNMDQAIRDQATASNNLTRVIIVPRKLVIVDS